MIDRESENMKKHNFIFLGECAVIIAILAMIAFLIRDEKRDVHGKESVTAVVEMSEEDETLTGLPETDAAEEAITRTVKDVVAGKKESSVQADSQKENLEPEKLGDETGEDKVKIVVFGDSIWADGRGAARCNSFRVL